MLVKPLSIWTLVRNRVFDFIVIDDATLLGVHEKHAAGLQTALVQDLISWNIEHAGFGSHDHESIFGHVVTRWTKSVPIQNCADLLAVGESDRGGTVPR